MAKRTIGLLALLLCLVGLLPLQALAASTEDAKEPIDPAAACSLTLSYGLPQVPVALYQIATVSADFQYTPLDAFRDMTLNGIRSGAEWQQLRTTLLSRILADSVTPLAASVTEESGKVTLDDLTPGLYLATAEPAVLETGTYIFETALVALPGLGEDGLWVYDLTVAAKSEFLPPIEPDDTLEFKLLKLWKNDESWEDRPQSITVEIFRNRESVEVVTLSEENNWAYSWTAKDDGATWMVAERNVPAGYSVTVEQKDTTFVITNSHKVPPPDVPDKPPKTGDSTPVLLYVVLMLLSGTALVALGLLGKRKAHE